ncbi:hypothetical protein SBY92_003332 [Candida maltosa Xu316]
MSNKSLTMSDTELPFQFDDLPEPVKPTRNSTTDPKKRRKEQTEEEYQHQLKLWQETGPTINTEDWLLNDAEVFDKIDINSKIDRVKVLHVIELCYYRKDYDMCLKYLEKAESLYNVDLDEIGQSVSDEFKKVTRKTKWNKKWERNISDLYNIKVKCKKKLNV